MSCELHTFLTMDVAGGKATAAETVCSLARSTISSLRPSVVSEYLSQRPIRCDSRLQDASIFDLLPPARLRDLRVASDNARIEASESEKDSRQWGVMLSRARGCLVALAVADGLGHYLEFTPVRDFVDEASVAADEAPVVDTEAVSAAVSPGDEYSEGECLYEASVAADEAVETVAEAMSNVASLGDDYNEGEDGDGALSIDDTIEYKRTVLVPSMQLAEPHFEYPSPNIPGGIFRFPINQFSLRRGQWTDDASMALCLADSLLSHCRYDGSDVRVWFWNWWNCGLNNAFRDDMERRLASRQYGSMSVGLGGNISMSLNEIDHFVARGGDIPPRFQSQSEDAGNGSLMRLGPVPLFFHANIAIARAVAYESSLTTHPGPLAAEACAFLAHVIVRAIHRSTHFTNAPEPLAAEFLDEVVTEYLTLISEAPDSKIGAKFQLRRLLLSSEPDFSTERCWNWRSPSLQIIRTLQNRGRRYNGYPVSKAYFGSFSFDGLALAMHCFYHTTSLNACIQRVINFRGDADTTGAITAQMAGAFYGVEELDRTWRDDLELWDRGGQIDLRAILLFISGDEEVNMERPVDTDKIAGPNSQPETLEDTRNIAQLLMFAEKDNKRNGSVALTGDEAVATMTMPSQAKEVVVTTNLLDDRPVTSEKGEEIGTPTDKISAGTRVKSENACPLISRLPKNRGGDGSLLSLSANGMSGLASVVVATKIEEELIRDLSAKVVGLSLANQISSAEGVTLPKSKTIASISGANKDTNNYS